MGNIIKIKHGNSIPIPENLENYELGYAQKGLYIKDNGQIICLNGADSLQGIIPIKKGGTGASMANLACKNLGAARVQAPNDLIHNGDEFTFISRDFNGDVWFNYRAYDGTGEISSYIFGKGKRTGGEDNHASIYIKQVISAAAPGVSWNQGRDKATVRNFIVKDSGFHPVVTSQSKQGYWSLGSLGDDTSNGFYFSYVADADYYADYDGSSPCYITPDGQFSGTAANVYGTVAVANGGTGMNSADTSGSVLAAYASYSSAEVRKYYNGLIFYGFTVKLSSSLDADTTRHIGTTSIRPARKIAVLATSTIGGRGCYDISIRVSTTGDITISNNGSISMPAHVIIHAAGVGLA